MTPNLDTPVWLLSWRGMIGLSSDLPQWVVASLAVFAIYALIVMPAAACMSFLERKISADLQARVGPNRAGPAGIFQPLADLLKLLQKDISSRPEKRSWHESLWLLVHSMALYSTVAVLPLGSLVLLIDTDMSAFLPFWAVLVLALGTMLLGLNQGSVPGWFGGVRIAAQTLAGAFPALIAVLCAGVRAGGFNWSRMANAQGFSPLEWLVFADPFQFVAFFVFLASGMVILGVPPLDGGISRADIHGGVSSHLRGRELSLFRLGRFYGFFFWCIIAVVMFLGAWKLPEFVVTAIEENRAWRALVLLELAWILAKTFGLVIGIVWIQRVTPRVRVDQITDLAWKVLSPFALTALTGATLWMALGGMK